MNGNLEFNKKNNMSTSHTGEKVGLSHVKFIAKNGLPVKACVKELRLDSIAFELIAAEKVCELADVLKNVEVTVGGKLAYEGELLVTAAAPVGLRLICEAKLAGKWQLDSFRTDDFFNNISEHLEQHTVRWAAEQEIVPEFRMVVADLETYLSGLENWCEQVECGGLKGSEERQKREAEVLQKLGPIVSLEIESHFADYERVTAGLEEGVRRVHRAHLMKVVHRFILQSPFSYRCFTKPLGYAGDYGMVKLMLGNPFQGATLFAKLLNFAFLETGPVEAHQNRIKYLVKTLRKVVSERAAKGLRTRVLNLGCGPAEEIQRFIESDPLAESCDFELLDFNPETLKYTEGKMKEAQARSGHQVNVRFIEESIQGFLREASRGGSYPKESYDLVYCAGLFDYLQQRFCAKLTEVMSGLTKEGGLAMVTNVSKENSIPAVMADFLEWTLVERTKEEMIALAPDSNLTLLKELKSDSTRINLFLELHKPIAPRHNVGTLEKINAAEVGRPSVLSEVRS